MYEIDYINDNNKSKYESLLNKSYDNMQQMVKPIVLKFGDVSYLIDGTDEYYSVVSDKLDCLVTLYENKINGYIEGSRQIQIRDNEKMKIVSKKDLFNGDLEQLFLMHSGENRPRAFLHYYQSKEEGKREVEFDYDVHLFENNIDAYLNYLCIKYPSSIIYNDYKYILGIIKKRTKNRYILDTTTSDYMRGILSLGNAIEVCSGKDYQFNLREIRELIRQAGFNEIVDPTMIDIYQDKDIKVKTLENLCNTYNKVK